MYITRLLVMAGFFLTAKTDETRNEVVCENEEMDLTCPKGYTIDILNTVYGKKDSRICSQADKIITNCEAYNSSFPVKSMCNQKQKCVISANNNVFGDPCQGYRKYLEVSYQCLRNYNIISSITCETQKFEIICPQNHYIKIVNAMYGQKNPLICYRDKYNQYTNKCDSLTATDILESSCNNLSNCSMIAQNAIFGDPCAYTHKYLEVDYLCLETVKEFTSPSPKPLESIAQDSTISLNNVQERTISPSTVQDPTISPNTVQETKINGLNHMDDLYIPVPKWKFPHSFLEKVPEVHITNYQNVSS